MTPPAIKAIETEYAGHRFRSRLEARWAVFFDHLGIRWQYEEQGYELPSGRYLPDFLLTGGATHGQADIWAEVKGVIDRTAFVRLARAAVELPDTYPWPNAAIHPKLLILGEVPEAGQVAVHARLDVPTTADRVVMQAVYFDLSTTGAYTKPIGDAVTYPLEWLERLPDDNGPWPIWTEPTYEPQLTTTPEIAAAYGSARAARFEHGESGA